MHEELDKITSEYEELNETLLNCNKHTVTLENNLKEQKTLFEKAKKEIELLNIKLEKCRIENDMANVELEEKKEKLAKKTKYAKVNNVRSKFKY